MKKLKDIKSKLVDIFKLKNIPTDEVDVLLSEILNVPLNKLFFVDEVDEKTYKKILYYTKIRLSGKPITKIFKKAYFYGLEFYINNNVLSPRQETEILVEKALNLIEKNCYDVLDLCTGSGAIAVSIAKNSNANITASDISLKALKIAKQNAKNNNVKINFVHSNLFEKINKKFNIIVSNPPYISTKIIDTLDEEVKFYDPVLALDGGEDGLKFYREIAQKSANFLKDNGYLLLEIGFEQFDSVEKLLKQNNFDTMLVNDYYGNNRVVIAKLKRNN